jgi:FkbM family methyltransferase
MYRRLARKHGYRIRSIWTMIKGFSKPLQTVAIFTGRAQPGLKIIGIRGSEQQFTIRGAMDAWCLKETLLDGCYERYGFAIEQDWTVIDIGGGIGDFTVLAATKSSRGRVYAFEPFPESFELMLHNLQVNGVANAEPLQIAITGRSRALTLDLSSGEPLMFESVDVAEGDHAIVESLTLAGVIERLAVDRLDLVKLDCEGAEYDILFNSPPDVIGRIQRIVMEYHDHTTEHTHPELVRFLQQAGFVVETFPSPVHPKQIGYLRAART